MKRYVGLYYASLNLTVVVKSFLGIFIRLITPRKKLHLRLVSLLTKNYGAGHWFCFSSGRGAITFMLRAAGIGNGDEVVISAYTCLAVPTAILALGAKPIYVDIDSDSLSMTIDGVAKLITPATKAIIVQHTLGNIFPIDKLEEKLDLRDILIIEDCALSIGSKINGCNIGFRGDASIFSMELSKTISCGWGGLLLINNEKYLSSAISFYSKVTNPNLFNSSKDFFQTLVSAFSYRPLLFHIVGKYLIAIFYRLKLFRNSTNAAEVMGIFSNNFVQKLGVPQTAIAEIQWKRFDEVAIKCAENFYEIATVATYLGYKVHLPKSQAEYSVSNRVSLLVKDPAEMVKYFGLEGIELGRWFDGPLSPSPVNKIFNYNLEKFPRAAKTAKHVVNIPSHSGLTIGDKDKIISLLQAYSYEHSPAYID